MKHWATQTSLKTGMNLCAQEGLSVPDPLVAPVMLLLNETNIVWYGYRVEHQYT